MTIRLLSFIFCALAATPVMAMETTAKQALLIDANSQTILLEKNSEEKMHPSSMSKLMTLYVLFQRLKDGRLTLDSTLPVSEKAWRMQGSKMFVHVGDSVRIEDLIHGIITQSGNDACVVVAEGLSGSEDAFAQEMNRIGSELGLTGSHFTNSTGWPDEGHLMTARDLAVLSERLIEDFPEYYPFFAVEEYTYNNIRQPNRNRLLNRDIGIDGLKTGHTEAGGYGIALSAKQGNRRLVLVVNGLPDDKARIEEGDRLMRYGFREFTNKLIVKKGEVVASADVWMGQKKQVLLTVEHDVEITLPANKPNDATFILKYEGPVPSPVIKGSRIANLIAKAPGIPDKIIPLVAAEDIDKSWWIGRAWSAVQYYLSRPNS